MEKKLNRRTSILLLTVLAIVLCLTLLFASLVVDDPLAKAEPSDYAQSITVSNVQVQRGTEFHMDIVLDGNDTGMYSLLLEVTFNQKVLTLTNVYRPDSKNKTELASGWAMPTADATISNPQFYSSYGNSANPLVIFLFSTKKVVGSGKVATLTFSVAPDAHVEDLEDYTNYEVFVVCNKTNTRVDNLTDECELAVTGGTVGVSYKSKWLKLNYVRRGQGGVEVPVTDAVFDGDTLRTIDEVVESEEIEPYKRDTSEYTYTFRSWVLDETLSSTDHLVYYADFDETPVPYTITFKQAIEVGFDDDRVLDYTDERLPAFLGADYLYDTETDTVGFGLPLYLENYKPTTGNKVHPNHTFVGWFLDEECTEPVPFASMPNYDVTLHGYFRQNIDPNFSDTTTQTKLATKITVQDGFVFATVEVTETFHFNALRFKLAYNADYLKLESFLFGEDSAFYGALSPTFPNVNADIIAGTADVTCWQPYESGTPIFAFMSSSYNATVIGKLITFKFSVKDTTPTVDTEIGIIMGAGDASRLNRDGSAWYVGTSSTNGILHVIRAEAPVQTTKESYVYADGNSIPYVFGTGTEADKGDTQYFVLSGNVQTEAGAYTVRAALITESDRYITWTNGSVADVTYPFTVSPLSVRVPVQFEDYKTRYVYTGDEIEYTFYQSLDSNYYDWVGSHSKTAAGTTDVTVALKDKKNTCWADDISSTKDKNFSFIVNKKVVIEPSIAPKEYNGRDQIATVAESLFYSVVNLGGKEIGSYDVILTLNNTDNYRWSTTDEAEVTLTFKIVQTTNYWEVSPYVISKYYDGDPIQTSDATPALDKELVSTEITFYNEDMSQLSAAPKDAGHYYVKFNVATTEGAEGIENTLYFEIWKISIVRPSVDPNKIYVYNGTEETFIFDTAAGQTDLYSITDGLRTNPGWQTVHVTLKDKKNYQWDNGNSDDLTFDFEIRQATLEGETDGYQARVTNDTEGFSAKDVATGEFTAAALSVSADDSDISTYVGRLKGIDSDVKNKCVVTKLSFSVLRGETIVTTPGSSFLYEITLSEADRTGYVVIYLEGDEVTVYETARIGEDALRFTADRVGSFLLLADHVFDIVDPAAGLIVKSAATCEEKAVYYKGCRCGESSRDYAPEEVFSYGEPLGHKYNAPVNDDQWIWADDYTCSVLLTCSVDGHVEAFPATVVMTNHVAPGKSQDGYIEYTAYYGDYTNVKVVTVPTDEHEYSDTPDKWIWTQTETSYEVTAVFSCLCHTDRVVKVPASVSYVVDEENKTISYTAYVLFNAREHISDPKTDMLPKVSFLDKGKTVSSIYLTPGDSIIFIDPPARDDGVFFGWLSATKGVLVIKDKEGAYSNCMIGHFDETFLSQWADYADTNVTVLDSKGKPIANATVTVYEGDKIMGTAQTGADGRAAFSEDKRIPYGNYSLVATYVKEDGSVITKTTIFDVDQNPTSVTVTLEYVRFNTKLNGEGSAEGLDNAISEEEKKNIKDDTTEGTVNEILITQTRTNDVSADIQAEMQRVAHNEEGNGVDILEFYDVEMVKTTIIRNQNGMSFTKQEPIYESNGYQTNIFPISSTLRQEIVAVGGTAENIFVYKRHTNEKGDTTIVKLPKVSAQEGASAQFECFFIKKVSGVEYIAIRQVEYSAFGFGVSGERVLLANNIDVTISDWIYGDDARTPYVKAKYGAATVTYQYGASQDGPFTSELPINAGLYYVKAIISPSSSYAGAQDITSFRIARKGVAKPQVDETRYVYNGEKQQYVVASAVEYSVSGSEQINAGSYPVTVSLNDLQNFIWEDGTNYPVTFEFVIEKKKLSDIEGISFENKTFYFDFNPHSIYITGELPEGITVEYDGNEETDFGRYYVKALLKSDNENYEVAEPFVAVMTISLNWIFIIIIIVVILVIFLLLLILVERAIRAMKKGSNGKNGDNGASAKEGGSNE